MRYAAAELPPRTSPNIRIVIHWPTAMISVGIAASTRAGLKLKIIGIRPVRRSGGPTDGGRPWQRSLRCSSRPRGRLSSDYARDKIGHRRISGRSDHADPTNHRFHPGQLLGCVCGRAGLRRFLEERGNTYVVTSDKKEAPDSTWSRELPNADVVISQPFWPAYLTPSGSPPLRLNFAITAGIGSDHVDLPSAITHGMTVAEVTYSDGVACPSTPSCRSWLLVHNYMPAHDWVTAKKGWNIADSVSRAYDLEGMDVGVLGSGRIGQAVLRHLEPFDVTLHYCDAHRLPRRSRGNWG